MLIKESFLTKKAVETTKEGGGIIRFRDFLA
jgi:hypothetical protein